MLDAFRPLLPPELYQRPKHGFDVPLLGWFKGELRSLIENDLLSDAFIESQGLFDVDAMRALRAQLFSANPGEAVDRVWGLIVFQHWWKKYLAPAPPAAAPTPTARPEPLVAPTFGGE